jgi:CRP-like cAMP-binding protein
MPSMADIGDVKLFQGLPPKAIKQIARGLKEVVQPAGKKIMIRGRNGVGFMMILAGEAAVELPDGRTVKLRPGDSFGEMALLDNRGRLATIRAVTDMRLLVVPQWEFKAFVTEHPEVAWRLLQQLSRDVRTAYART